MVAIGAARFDPDTDIRRHRNPDNPDQLEDPEGEGVKPRQA
ncbi:hypothetical protein [Ottowia thiooxydans]|nr:hypothetical protein [Ottowia thiooxydans]